MTETLGDDRLNTHWKTLFIMYNEKSFIKIILFPAEKLNYPRVSNTFICGLAIMSENTFGTFFFFFIKLTDGYVSWEPSTFQKINRLDIFSRILPDVWWLWNGFVIIFMNLFSPFLKFNTTKNDLFIFSYNNSYFYPWILILKNTIHFCWGNTI